MFRLERWKAGALLGTWVAYWAALVGLTIGPGLLKAWRLTHDPALHGTVTASIDGGNLLFSVKDATAGAAAWTFTTSVPEALLWIALPPLAVWALWLVSRPRRDALLRPDELLGETREAIPPPAGVPEPLHRPRAGRDERVERSS